MNGWYTARKRTALGKEVFGQDRYRAAITQIHLFGVVLGANQVAAVPNDVLTGFSANYRAGQATIARTS
jgi:hypothetical protein